LLNDDWKEKDLRIVKGGKTLVALEGVGLAARMAKQ